MKAEHLLPLCIALPLAGGFLIPLLAKISKKLSEVITVVISITMLFFLKYLWGLKDVSYKMGDYAPPLGINLVFDRLSFLMLL